MARKLPVYIDSEEFYKILKNTKRNDHKIAFILGFESGLRISEIAGREEKDGREIKPLSVEQIDIKNKRIRIEGGKGDVDRIVPLPKHFKQSMVQYFPLNKRYKNIDSARRGLQRSFKKAAKAAGVLQKKPGIHFHSLRHSFGSRMANQGIPIHHIRSLMGHSNISTTNIYLISNPENALIEYENKF